MAAVGKGRHLLGSCLRFSSLPHPPLQSKDDSWVYYSWGVFATRGKILESFHWANPLLGLIPDSSRLAPYMAHSSPHPLGWLFWLASLRVSLAGQTHLTKTCEAGNSFGWPSDRDWRQNKCFEMIINWSLSTILTRDVVGLESATFTGFQPW